MCKRTGATRSGAQKSGVFSWCLGASPLPLLADLWMVSFLAASCARRPASMRTRLRRTVIVIVVLLLGTVGGLVGRSMWQQHKREIVTKGLEYLPGVSQHIQDFRRV